MSRDLCLGLQIVKLFAESLDHMGQLEATSLFHYLKPRRAGAQV